MAKKTMRAEIALSPATLVPTPLTNELGHVEVLVHSNLKEHLVPGGGGEGLKPHKPASLKVTTKRLHSILFLLRVWHLVRLSRGAT